jgi:hypothetical protein
VSRAPYVQRICERLIGAGCRRLPADLRAERCREWAAELPAILDDPGIRPGLRRAVRALAYSAGVARITRQLSRAGEGARPAAGAPWRNGAMRHRPLGVAARATVGAAAWLLLIVVVISLARAFPHQPGWVLAVGLGLAAGFDALCLADIARARQVRYLPKWAWVLICLAQCPLGGIIYLSIGRLGQPRPVPPRPA